MQDLQQALTPFVLTVPVIKVTGVVSHYAMHNDELLALWFAIQLGEKHFPGIKKAPLSLVDSGLRSLGGKTAQEWLKEGYISLGTGGGPFDEHDLPPDIRAKTSAATLMAEYLGIMDYAPIRAMLDHAVRVDRTATAAGFDISALAKAWHRNAVPTPVVRRMFDRAADARFNVLSGRIHNPTWATRPTLNRLAAQWLIETTAPEEYEGPTNFETAYEAAEHMKMYGSDSFGPILEYLQDGKHNPNDIFSLYGTIEALNKDGAKASEIREFALVSLSAKLAEQDSFLEGYDELRELKRDGKLYVGGSQWRIMHVVSDNTEINRSARHLDKNYDVFVQRQTDGHMVIWYNKKKFNMDSVAARLRIGDRMLRKMPKISFNRLLAEGTLPEAPWWYHNPDNGQIMCGALTNRSTPVTRLDDNAVIACIISGLKAVEQSKTK